MSKKIFSERDICTKFITPALENAGWDKMKQFREEVNFTDGRIIVRGKLSTRGKKKRADYILYYKPNIPIGIIEVKENNHEVGAGMQQGLEYSDILQLPFVFSTNGDRFLFHDKTNSTNVETEIELDDFPSPEQLWSKYLKFKGLNEDDSKSIVEQDYFFDGSRSGLERYGNEISKEVGNKTVITFKDHKELFQNSPDEIHFGNCSGYNILNGQDLVVVGTPHRNNIECFLLAKLMNVEFDMDKSPFRYQRVQYNDFEFMMNTFDNLELREIQFSLIESDLIQAVGRARSLRNKCLIEIYSGFPLCITDEFIIKKVV